MNKSYNTWGSINQKIKESVANKRPKMGEVDMLFVRTKDLDTVGKKSTDFNNKRMSELRNGPNKYVKLFI